MIYYKSKRTVGGKSPTWVIVDENGNVVNINPSRDILKDLEIEPYKDGRSTPRGKNYTDEELLICLKQFYEIYGRPPTKKDFNNDPEYPNGATYDKYFGSWSNALKLVGLDVESMIKKGVIETSDQKSRLAEMIVRNHFKIHPTDLAGENKNNPCDGICPNGKTYDVKSSGLHRGTYYAFKTDNKYKEKIDIYYFIGFNKDWTKIRYVWRVPGKIVEKGCFYIGLTYSFNFNIENMKEYDITNKFRYIL